MRYKAEQLSDGSWAIYDTHKGERCFGIRSCNHALAERWSETFNAAYAAFRDETRSPLLPVPDERWIPRRKAMVVIALREGAMTTEEICRRYDLSPDELAGWISAFEQYGVPGLRATRVQIYRHLEKAAAGQSAAAPPAAGAFSCGANRTP